MKKFYLENMRTIHKFLINQIALSLFGIMITWPVSASSMSLILIMTAFSAVFFCYLQYDIFWSLGATHRNRVTNGRMSYSPLLGLKIAAFSYIPSAFLVFLCYISQAFLNLTFFKNLYLIVEVIYAFLLNGMYSGAQIALNKTFEGFDNLLPWVFPVAWIPALVVCALGYYLGLNDKQIKCFFGMAPSTGEDGKKKR